MSAQYNKIRLCAFRLKHNLPAKNFYALKFPEEAKDLIKILVAERDSRTKDKVRIPIASLNAALRASIPGLIYIGKIWEKFWLYSPVEIPKDKLSVIFSHWLDTEFSNENPNTRKKGITSAQREAAMKLLLPDKLKWESVTLKTELWKKYANATTNIAEDADGFILLPDILATQLSDPNLKFKLDDETIQFYRCAPSEGAGAELISWPPLSYTQNKRTYYYSIVLTLKVQTVPFQPYPQLQCDMSIRRWSSINDTGLLPGGQASSVYIRDKVKWGEKINPYGYTEYFQVAPMVWKGEPKWDNNLANLLEKFNPLPYTPKEILANPIQALNIPDIPNICITYKDGIIPDHKVGKGLPPTNRRQLAEQIALLLQHDWELIDYKRFNFKIDTKQSAQIFDLPKPDGTSWELPVPEKERGETEEEFLTRTQELLTKQEAQQNKFKKKKGETDEQFKFRYEQLLYKQQLERDKCQKKEDETDEHFQSRYAHYEKRLEQLSSERKRLREAIRKCIGKEITIENWYINESTRDALIKAVWYCLGLKTATAGIHNFPDIDLTVTIRTQEIGKLAERLPLSTDTKKRPNSKQRKEAINTRMDEIAETVNKISPVTGKVGVLVELYGENHWKPEWTDPQSAIRLGFAQETIDRLSKFIVPEHEELKNKYENAARNEGRGLNKREQNEINELQEELPQKAITSFLDLLRSLGVQIAPPRIVIPSAILPNPITYVGLWLVNRTSKTSAHGKQQLIPVMGKMRSDSQTIEATFNGLSDWIPYDEALRQINKKGISITGDNNELKKEIKGFVKRMLQSKELRGKDTLLLCDAQNIRRYWTWLQDTQISHLGIVFGTESPQLIPKLRVVRVRQGGETPEWYALHDNKKQKMKLFDNLVELEQISVATEGLFYTDSNEPNEPNNNELESSKRIFLSIGEKSNTMPKEKLDFSKLDKPQLYWSNPAILELAVACIQPGDDPRHWAVLTHELRRMALQYKDTLARPIVLHLAAQMADYVLMVDEDSSEDE